MCSSLSTAFPSRKKQGKDVVTISIATIAKTMVDRKEASLATSNSNINIQVIIEQPESKHNKEI